MFNANDLKYLVDAHPILSLYLNVNPTAPENRSTSPAWRIWLKTTLKEMDSKYKDNAAWQAVRARAEDYFASYTANSKGLALFIGESVERSMDLPVTVSNRAAFGEPVLTPLLWVMDEYEPYIIIRVDHEKAQLMAASVGSIQQQQELKLELHTADWHERVMVASATVGGAQRSSSYRDHFDARVEAYTERFYQDVAKHAQELGEKLHTRRVILGGNREAAHALQNLLQGMEVIAILPLTMLDQPDAVLAAALPVALEYERKQESALVDEVIGFARAGGRGVMGREKVALALQQGRVELLIAAWTGDDDPVLERLTGQAVAAGASVELVRGEAAKRLQSDEGLAARLYYAMKPV